MHVTIAAAESLDRVRLAVLLSNMGHMSTITVTCAEALTTLEGEHQADLMIVDTQLPGGEGLRLIREARARDRATRLPILAISHAITVSEVSTLLRLGADRFLPRPIRDTPLARELTPLLGLGEATTASAPPLLRAA